MKFYPAKDYQARCKKKYDAYKANISQVLPDAQVEHIGASSVPNCISKGDLDIYVAVELIHHQESIAIIKKIGFSIKQDTHRTEELCMLESNNDDDVAIQLIAKGSEFENFLIFRNALLDNPKLVEKYNQMKHSCAGMTQDRYREIKSEFIEGLIVC